MGTCKIRLKKKEKKKKTYTSFGVGEGEESGNVGKLDSETNAVDRGDENAVGMNDSIEDPKNAVKCCCDVWDGAEFLHGLLLPDSEECGAKKSKFKE